MLDGLPSDIRNMLKTLEKLHVHTFSHTCSHNTQLENPHCHEKVKHTFAPQYSFGGERSGVNTMTSSP